MPLQINLPSRGALVTKTGLWTGAMWAWMRDITKAITAGGGPAPVDAEYLVGGADPALTNERVVTNTATATWDLTTAGQAAVNVVASAVLDLIGSTRGSILYRGAFGWAIRIPGTTGQMLETQGAGADPVWATPTGGTVTSVTGTSPIASSGGTTPAISLNDTAVTPGAYGSSTQVATFTVDQKGRLTAAANVAISSSGGAATEIGLDRVLGDGATTSFPLPDLAEYLIAISDDGLVVDPAIYSLSADRAFVDFDAAPTSGNVLTFEYVMATV